MIDETKTGRYCSAGDERPREILTLLRGKMLARLRRNPQCFLQGRGFLIITICIWKRLKKALTAETQRTQRGTEERNDEVGTRNDE